MFKNIVLFAFISTTACSSLSEDSKRSMALPIDNKLVNTTTQNNLASLIEQTPLIEKLEAVKLNRIPEGAILEVTGIPIANGYWGAKLVEVKNKDNSKIIYELKANPPNLRHSKGTEKSRRLIVVEIITAKRLKKIKLITIIGKKNRISIKP
ncbi:MAG: putative lipoprotein YmbA [Paracoccaceae bacterium]|jgi:uncharacterized lipoprotein YmbA